MLLEYRFDLKSSCWMNTKKLKYSLAVFLAGSLYGVLASLIKLALAEGFSWNQIVASQTLGGFTIFLLVFAITATIWKKRQKVTRTQVLRLTGLGIVGSMTSIFYNLALSMMSVAAALTLLFQFVWIGIVIQVVTTHRRPHAAEIIAGLIVFGGTILGSGLLEAQLEGVDPIGVVFGLISAVSCASFVHLSGRIETGVPHIQRSLNVSFGTVLSGMAVCPDFFTSGVLEAGIWKYGLFLGIFAYVGPILLLGIGTPHLPTGLNTILTSAELPFGIIFSALVLGETISELQTFGIIAVLAGVIVSQLPYLISKKERSPAPG